MRRWRRLGRRERLSLRGGEVRACDERRGEETRRDETMERGGTKGQSPFSSFTDEIHRRSLGAKSKYKGIKFTISGNKLCMRINRIV